MGVGARSGRGAWAARGAYAVPAFPMEVPFAVEMEEVLEAVHVV